MAGMITPTRGLLTTLAVLTAFLNLRQNRAGLIAYVLGVALVPTVLIVYLALNGSLLAAFEDVILWTASRYAAIQHVPFGLFASPQNFPLIYLFPLAFFLALLVCARDWRAVLRDRALQLCAVLGIAGFIGCFPRPDIAHIAFAAPLAYPLLVLCVSRLSANWHLAFRLVFAVVAIGLHIPSILVSVLSVQHALNAEVTSTARGDVQFFQLPGSPETRGKMLARIATLPPGDSFFFYPYLPMVPFLTGREHVAKYDIFLPYLTLPSQYHDACLSVIRHASWLVIDHTWTGPGKWKELYPTMPVALPQETIEFEHALDLGFEFVAQDGTFELRQRRQDVGDDICAVSAK
jgi:hypothetical protein